MKRALSALVCTMLVTTAQAARADDAACIDANEKSITLRRAGKLRDALKQVAVCGAAACPREIADECTRRARALDDALPTLILSATDGAGGDLATAKVSIDGVVTAEKLDGQPVSLDPGAHTIRMENGGAVLEKTLVLRENEKARRENFVLAKPVAPKPVVPAPPPVHDQGLGTQRTMAVFAGGVGVAGLALGIVTGLVANGKQSSEQSACSAASCPDYPGARSDYDSARTFATISTVGFVAGVALLATGTVLWFTAPRSRSATGTLTTPLRWTF